MIELIILFNPFILTLLVVILVFALCPTEASIPLKMFGLVVALLILIVVMLVHEDLERTSVELYDIKKYCLEHGLATTTVTIESTGFKFLR